MTIYTLLAIICLAGSILLIITRVFLNNYALTRITSDIESYYHWVGKLSDQNVEMRTRIGRLEETNLELMKERAELDAKFLEWTKAIHKDIDELKGDVLQGRPGFIIENFKDSK